ncbi:MAG: PD-(D/E)XK nuclease-like domain-containing protein [Pseudobacteriovorax sp.]|nr:PD-(D/E)XK nuclease-like domain-containing protein [Pseudobacteriovorax sp.]
MILTDEPIETYHSESEHLSKSGIDLILQSPRHYWDRYRNKKTGYSPTSAQNLGIMIHEMLLEPHLFETKYICGPEGSNRTHKAFKELVRENEDKQVLPYAEWQKLHTIKDSALSQRSSKLLLEYEGQNEVSCYWKDERTGRGLKCRPDRLIGDRSLVVDLKTTEDASYDKFTRKAADFGYHRSVALTTRGLKELTGDDYTYLFLVVETKPPFNVATFKYEFDDIVLGNDEINLAISLYDEAVKTGFWPGYGSGIQTLTLPPWKKRTAV